MLGSSKVNSMKNILIFTVFIVLFSTNAFCLAPRVSLKMKVTQDVTLLKVTKDNHSISGVFKNIDKTFELVLLSRENTTSLLASGSYEGYQHLDVFRDGEKVGWIEYGFGVENPPTILYQISIEKKREKNATLAMALLRIYFISENLDKHMIRPFLGFPNSIEGEVSKKIFTNTFPQGKIGEITEMERILKSNLIYPQRVKNLEYSI